MAPATEAALRTVGGIIAFAVVSSVLTFFANTSDLTFLGGAVAPIVGTLAGVLLAAFDKAYSANGTIVFGTVGSVLR